ncbi:MAG: aldo/keto reductase [Gemmatimonadetes bacterium]|nr:aldo/keto reductase [Gemmatimonadota bacterium]MBI3504619.1 aldo/keto reductase [Pseudomonadota bacterium]
MPKAPPTIEQRSLGRTGRGTSILALSTSRLARAGQREAIRIIQEAIDHGVNVIETAWEYGEGRTERWLGMALKDGYRERVTLVWQCCAHQRDYKTAMQQLDESLARVKTAAFDVWSFHEMIYDNDIEWLYDHGGLDAAQEAREQGRARWLAFGGHKSPHIHLKLLQRGFAWDAVMMPLNPLDATFRSFEKQVLPEVVRRGIAVMATKPIAGGAIAGARVLKPEESLRYCFSLPVSTVLCGIDSVAVLRKNLKLAATFKAFHAGEMDALRQKARAVAGDGRFERYKTTQDFDGLPGRTAHGYVT